MMNDQIVEGGAAQDTEEIDKVAALIIHAAEKYLARKVAGPAAFLMADNDKTTPTAALQDWQLFQRHKAVFLAAPRLLYALEQTQAMLPGRWAATDSELMRLISCVVAEAKRHDGEEWGAR